MKILVVFEGKLIYIFNLLSYYFDKLFGHD